MKAFSYPASLLPRPLLENWLNTMCHITGLEGEVELQLVSDAAIAALNQDFLACSGPTNILSFPAEDPADTHSLVLSVDTLRRECLLYSQTHEEHALRLISHGFAHLTGLDHSPEMDILCENIMNTIRHKKEPL